MICIRTVVAISVGWSIFSAAALRAETISWNVDSDGFFDVATNWSPQQVPTSADDVIIDRAAGTYVVTVRQNQQVGTIQSSETLAVTAGAINIGGPSTIYGSLQIASTVSVSGGTTLTLQGSTTWSEGLINGAGDILNKGTFTLTGAVLRDLGALFVNEGSIVHSGTASLRIGDGFSGRLINQPGGVYSFTAGGSIVHGGAGAGVTNFGTLRMATASIVSISCALNGNGAIFDLQGGQLVLSGGGSESSSQFIVSNGAVVDLTGGGARSFTGAMTGNGAGQVRLDSGTLFCDQATLDFELGLFRWGAGQLNAGSVTTNTGEILMESASIHDLGGFLVNESTFRHAASGDMRIGNGFNGQFINEAGSSFIWTASGGIVHGGGGSGVINRGTFVKTGGGSSSISAAFSNQGGTIDVQADQVTLSNGGSSSNGTITVSAGAILDVTGGNAPVWTGLWNGSGDGTVLLSGGTLHTPNAILNFSSGLFHWIGGQINAGSDVTTNTGELNISTAGVVDLGGLHINTATINHNGPGQLRIGNGFNGELRNEAGGLFEFFENGSVVGGGGGNGFENRGTFRKTDGEASVISCSFRNLAGLVDLTTSTLVLQNSGASNDGTIQLANDAVLDITGNSSPSWTGLWTGSGDGTVLLAGGTLHTGGATLDFDPGVFLWTGGQLNASGETTNTGEITVAPGTTIDLGGVFFNAGNVLHPGSGNLRIGNGFSGEFRNLPGSLFELQSSGGIVQGGAGNGFENRSTLRKTGVPGSTISCSFRTIEGLIDVQEGSLVFSGGGSSREFSIHTAAGTLLDVTGGGAASWTGAVTGTGAGQVLLTNGSLSVAGATLNFAPGQFIWQGGLLHGGAGATNIGDINLSGTALVDLGGLLTNQATILHNGSVQLRIGDGGSGRFVNTATGLYESHGSGPIVHGGAGQGFDNLGIFRKVTGGDMSISAAFHNQAGTINVESNKVFMGGGNSTGATIEVDAGATLHIAATGSTSWTGAYTGIGAGEVLLDGNVLDASGAVLNFAPGLFKFRSGLMNGSVTTNTGEIVLSGSGLVDLGANFFNEGTVKSEGTLALRIGNGSTGKFNNLAGALFDFTSNGNIFNGGGGAGFDNHGTIRKSGGTNSSISANFSNLSGVIEVLSGNLVLANNGSSSGGFINVDAGASLDVTGGGTPFWSGDYVGSGNGLVLLNNGRLGTGDATLNFPPDMFRLRGGQLVAFGETTNTGNLLIDATDNIVDLGGTLNNAGTIRHAGTNHLRLGNGSSGRLVNYGTLSLEDTGTFVPGGGGQGITNHGFFRRAVSSADVGIPVFFDNLGEVHSLSSNLVLSSTPQFSGNTLTGGVWKIVSPGALSLNAGGPINTNAGHVILEGIASSFPQFNSLSLNQGTVEVRNGHNFTTAGPLTNQGTLTVGSESAVLIPATLTEGAAATLAIELGGSPETNAFGRVMTSGTATLDGNLSVTLVSGYGPSATDIFTVMEFPSHSGVFDSFLVPIFNGTPAFEHVVNDTSVVLNSLVSSSDLAVTSVVAPANATVGQDVTIEYTVENLGEQTFFSQWQDSLFLSRDNALSDDDILLTRTIHNGALITSETYTNIVTAAVPGLEMADYYVLAVVDSRRQEPDQDRSNNVGVSAGRLSADIEVLPLNVVTPGIIRSGQLVYYRMAAVVGTDIIFKLTSSVPGQANVYIGRNRLPSPTSYDMALRSYVLTEQTITIPIDQGGSYYVLVEGKQPAGSGSSYSLHPRLAALEISSFTPESAGNIGNVTMTINGSNFTPATTVQLEQSGSPMLLPVDIQFLSRHQIAATFALAGFTPGAYDLRVKDASQSALAMNPFTVSSGGVPGRLVASITSPRHIRRGITQVASITYRNAGGTDIPAPFMTVFPENAWIKLPEQPKWSKTGLMLLGINKSGLAGILPPGYEGTIQIEFVQVVTGPHVFNTLTLMTYDPGTPFDLNELKEDLRPGNFDPAVWDIVYDNFLTDAGTTVDSFQALLGTNATSLGKLGEYTFDAGRLLGYIFLQADAYGSISRRYQDGKLGRGWPDPTTYQVVADTKTSDMLLLAGTNVRRFHRQINGTFKPDLLDKATFTFTGGKWILKEQDGSVHAFHSDGRLDYHETIRGDRQTATYSSGMLSGFVGSKGQTITYSYDANERIDTITGPVGHTTVYEYDAQGRRESLTRDGIKTQYGYVNSGNAAQLNALETVTYPNGQVVSYTYDTRGRVETQTVNGHTTTFTYPEPGSVVVDDGGGNLTSYRYDDRGRLRTLEGAAGDAMHVKFEPDGDLSSIIGPGGLGYAFEHDAQNRLKTSIDSLGGKLILNYDKASNKLRSIQNPRGALTSYNFNNKHFVSRVTAPDGTTESMTYTPHGDVEFETDALGRTTEYHYGSNDFSAGLTLPGGAAATRDNNGFGRIETVDIDGDSTITVSYDTLSRIDAVDYPDARSLQFGYAGSGEREKLTDATGFDLKYVYDAHRRLEELRDPLDNAIVTYTYDSAGRVSRKDFANGAATVYTYDPLGKPASMTHFGPGNVVLASFLYDHNELGRLATVTTATGSLTYAYDSLGRMKSAIYSDGPTINYVYDSFGNRIQQGDSVSTVTYVYDDRDRLISYGIHSLEYDNAGNLLSDFDGVSTTSYTYDNLNRLVDIAGPGRNVSVEYDALGQIAAITRNGNRLEYVHDPTGRVNAIDEFDNVGTFVARYIYGFGLECRIDAAGNRAYYNFDIAGNTIQLTDDSGTVANSYDYLPFGELRSAAGTIPNSYLFGGQFGMYDLGESQYLTRRRLYDASTGRFTSPDPIPFVWKNRYTYAGNNPSVNCDESGYDPQNAFESTTQAMNVQDSAFSTAELMVHNVIPRNLIDQINNQNRLFRDAVEAFNEGRIPLDDLLKSEEALEGMKAELRAFEESAGVFGKLGQLSPLFDAADVAVAGNTIKKYNEGNATGMDVTHDLANVAGDALGYIPHPVAQVGARIIPIVDVGSQVALNWWFTPNEPDPSQVFGERGRDLLDDGNPNPTHSENIDPFDPNLITGPEPFAEANTVLPYTIYFENKSDASAAAQHVVITHQLDADVDMSTFEVGDFGFGDTIVSVPSGQNSYSTRVDMSATALGLYVDFMCSVDPATRIVTWDFASIDPETGQPTLDALAGFLPPNVNRPEGEGFVSYRIYASPPRASGTQVDAQATIVFDFNDPLDTNVTSCILDAETPSSSIDPLPPVTAGGNVSLTWSGSDEPNGSGIAAYDIYASANGGPFELFLDDTTATQAVYPGDTGNIYAFYSIATDQVFHREDAPITADAVTETTVAANLRVEKSCSGTTSPLGQAISWTIVVTNDGPDAATDLVIVDELPAGITLQSVDSLPYSPSLDGSTLTVEVPDLGAGASATVTIHALPDDVGTYDNQTSATSEVLDVNPANNFSQCSVTVVPAADLEIVKQGPANALLGQQFTYTIHVTNHGPSTVTNVVVTDLLPATVAHISSTPSQGTSNPSGSSVVSNLGSILPDGEATISVTVLATSAGPATNTAIVSSDVVDPATGNNQSQATTTINPHADLVISKSAAPDPVMALANLTYTVVVTNAGPSDAPDVTVTDTLSTTVVYKNGLSAQGSVSHNGGVVTGLLGTIPTGESTTMTVVVSPQEPGVLSNSVSVAASVADLVQENNSSSTTVTVIPHEDLFADVGITKAVSQDPGIVGQQLTFTLVATNDGPDTATNVLVSDPLTSDMLHLSSSSTHGTVSITPDQQVIAELGSIPMDGVATVTVNVMPTLQGIRTNSAFISSDQEDQNPANNATTVTVTITGGDGPDLTGQWVPSRSNPTPVIQVCRIERGKTVCRLVGGLRVNNSGTARSGRFTVRFYLSDDSDYDEGVDTLIGESRFAGIRAGGRAARRVLKPVPQGVTVTGKHIIAVIDPGNVVTEGNELNNVATIGPIP